MLGMEVKMKELGSVRDRAAEEAAVWRQGQKNPGGGWWFSGEVWNGGLSFSQHPS